MKKVTFIVIIIACSLGLKAQQLFLNDMFNGNYIAYRVGDPIEFFMADSAKLIKGTISQINANSILLSNSNLEIPIQQINAVIRKNGKALKRVLAYATSVVLITTGTIYFAAGIIAATEIGALGVAISAVGGGMIAGGTLILIRQGKQSKKLDQYIIDNKTNRLFVE